MSDEVLRCAAAAGCEVDQVNEVRAAGAVWQDAALIVLDEAAVQRCAAAGLARRDVVVVVCENQPSEQVWKAAVALGAQRVSVLPDDRAWLCGALGDAMERPAAGAGRVIAVLGGCGGAGASVLAGAVAAVSARRGADVLLVDCDPFGGGLDVTVGMDGDQGLRWPGLRLADGRVSAGSLRSALPQRAVHGGRVSVLSCTADGVGPDPQAVGAVLDAGSRAGMTVVCDVARTLGAAAVTALHRADLTALVVPARARACAAARQVVAGARAAGAAPRTVVRGPSPGGLRPVEVAAEVGAPLLVAMRAELAVPETVDAGRLLNLGRGALRTAARTTLHAAADSTEATAATARGGEVAA